MKHLLVTNDFPPKVGGIQTYLWELWRRLPPGSFRVLTIAQPGDCAFDRAQSFAVDRVPVPMLLPTPALTARVGRVAREWGAGLVVLDPALPVGLIGPRLRLPYAVVLHGAEVSVPGRLPGVRQGLAGVLRRAELAIVGGRWTEAETRRVAGSRAPALVNITPGVDLHRFRPADPGTRAAARRQWGLPVDGRLVLGVGRLVPRKGMMTLARATSLLAPSRPDLTVAVVGIGREDERLARHVTATGAPVRLLGRVPDRDLPALHAAADVFCLPCRSRWAGLEQEGFGIVFLEAAASGVPSVAGRSGGAGEAVRHGETGLVVERPASPPAVAAALARLLDDPEERACMGRAARDRAERCFSYDGLADRLAAALEAG